MIEYLQGLLQGKNDGIPVRLQMLGAVGAAQFRDITLVAVDGVGAVCVEKNRTECRLWSQIAAVFPAE